MADSDDLRFFSRWISTRRLRFNCSPSWKADVLERIPATTSLRFGKTLSFCDVRSDASDLRFEMHVESKPAPISWKHERHICEIEHGIATVNGSVVIRAN